MIWQGSVVSQQDNIEALKTNLRSDSLNAFALQTVIHQALLFLFS